MKKYIIIILMVFLVSCSSSRITIKQEPVIVADSAFEIVKDMKIGWNLGNSLEAMSKKLGFTFDTETIWSNPLTTQKMIDTVKNSGFRSIRIPVSYYNHIDENGVVDEKWFARVEEVVKWALDADLYTIINIHHDTGMDPNLNWIFADCETIEQSLKDYCNIWSQIAERFKDYDHRLLFQSSGEWMNKDRNWNRSDSMDDFMVVHELNQAFIDVVRASGGNNINRFLMISPFSASAEEDIVRAMFYIPFKDDVDNRLILSVHSYSSNKQDIEKGALALKKISDDYNIPVVIDEFGVKVTEPRNKQIGIVETYVKLAVENGFTCMFWDDGYEYRIVDRNKLEVVDKDLLNKALLIVYGIE